MGIGNQPPIFFVLPVLTAHYPSWGLGTSALILLTSSSGFSLPLMGIGNRGDFRIINQKRSSPHYPSWGLGTSKTLLSETSISFSLPLMGIGNTDKVLSGTGNVAAHYPSWGLGTSVMLNSVIFFIRLITPHGDWEP